MCTELNEFIDITTAAADAKVSKKVFEGKAASPLVNMHTTRMVLEGVVTQHANGVHPRAALWILGKQGHGDFVPATRKSRYGHDNFTHKGKNFTTGVGNQDKLKNGKGKLESLLIKKEVLYSVSMTNPSAFALVISVLEHSEDKMNIVAMQEILSPEFVTALREQGEGGTAAVLDLIGGVMELFDQQGLSLPERFQRAEDFMAFHNGLFPMHQHLWTTDSLPQHIGGVASWIFTAMHRYIVSWVVLQALGVNLVCRKLGTYDLEGTFGQLVRILGFKPDLGMALNIIHKKVHCLMWFRETYARGFTVPESSYSVYNT